MSSEQLSKLQDTLLAAITKTNQSIESLQNTFKTDIENVRAEVATNTQRLDKVESDLKSNSSNAKVDELLLQIERLKQDRLRNNVRITGLPQSAFNDPDETILRIAELLNIDVIPSDYSVYVDRNKSSIIVAFANHVIKRSLIDAMRRKQSLLVEEILDSAQSNSRIYINDQLSPHYAKLFQLAWQAKRSGTLFSASSTGGRIRVKKFESSQPYVIETEADLQCAIDRTEQMDTAPQPSEPSQRSYAAKTTQQQQQFDSPESMNSDRARQLRGKAFSHQRQFKPQPARSEQQSSSKHHTNNPPHRQTYNQRREPLPKRNNRHVSSLDNRTFQPNGKKTRVTRSDNDDDHLDRNQREFKEYSRQYQSRLRGFTK